MSTDLAPAIPVRQSAAAGGAMPGWHIYADLTPPELITLRRVRQVRVWVMIIVLLVGLLVAAGHQFTRMQATEAAETVATEQARSEALRAQQSDFTGVTALQNQVAQAKQQLGALLASDVDVDALIGEIWGALPEGMTIDQFSVTLPAQVGSDSGSRSGAAALDTSADAHIGTVTLSGTGTDIDSLASFVDRLQDITGVFAPFPTSNAANADGGTTYSVQLTVTDARYSGLYVPEGEG